MLFEPGTIVQHRLRPEWGPGKVVTHKGNKNYIYFRDRNLNRAIAFKADYEFLEKSALVNDARLDHLPRFVEMEGEMCLPDGVITWDEAAKLFQDEFPLWFRDARYSKQEREYKASANADFRPFLLGGEAGELLEQRNVRGLVRRTFSILGRAQVGNLLASVENAALHDALKDEEAAYRFFSSLLRVLQTPDISEPEMCAYFDAVASLPAERSRVASWPIATFLPFIASPEHHMFLKPDKTKKAAERLGFDLHYTSMPNWDTYKALLAMCNLYLQKLRDYGAEDFIDVQSFIFVAGGGYKEP